jgi:AAA ATPase domain
MLYGRRQDRARIAALLAGARAGRSGVLVVRGEAGTGKHALLADAAAHADGFRLLRCTGDEAEVELPFAALRQLLGPVLDRLDRVPAPKLRPCGPRSGWSKPGRRPTGSWSSWAPSACSGRSRPSGRCCA